MKAIILCLLSFLVLTSCTTSNSCTGYDPSCNTPKQGEVMDDHAVGAATASSISKLL